MNNFIDKILAAVLMAFITTACSSTLGYMKNSGDPASPGDKEFVFSLRTSSILISKLEKTPNNSAQPAPKKGDTPNNSAQPAGQSPPANTCPDPKDGKEVPTGDAVLSECLLDVSAQAAAARDKSAFYVARPGFGTTVTSTTAVDTDPFMIKSITLNYKNPAIGIVTSAGAGAAAGFGVGGPMGAVIGGLLGGGGAAAAAGAPPKVEIEWVEKNICKEDWQTGEARFDALKGASKQAPPQLFLPVAIDYKNEDSLSLCWHPLPNRSGEAVKAAMVNPEGPSPLSGWFYRIVEGKHDTEFDNGNLPPVLPANLKDLHAPFQTREEYFSYFNRTNQQETFPVSACRSVEVQVTWWEMLNTKEDSVKHYGYPMTVADFDYVQAVRLPKNGAVYLLPVCGGYSSSTQSSSSVGDVIDAIVKQVQAVKAAQTSNEKK
jgi:hypothetical protein